MARHLTLAALVLVAAAVAPVAAQEDAKYTLEGKEGGWEIEVLLAKLAELPDLNVVYDPQSPQLARKKIEFEGRVNLTRQEFFDWLRSLLFFHRLVLVPIGPPNGSTYSVVDLNSPMVTQHPVHVPASELSKWKNRDGTYITTTIQLKHLTDTARARNALAQICTRQIGRVNDNPSSQSFVIADFAPVVWAMAQILEGLDRDAATANPTAVALVDPRIKNYEQKLAQCQTETAAAYFAERIKSLLPKKK
jgi:hypothetical protein